MGKYVITGYVPLERDGELRGIITIKKENGEEVARDLGPHREEYPLLKGYTFNSVEELRNVVKRIREGSITLDELRALPKVEIDLEGGDDEIELEVEKAEDEKTNNTKKEVDTMAERMENTEERNFYGYEGALQDLSDNYEDLITIRTTIEGLKMGLEFAGIDLPKKVIETFATLQEKLENVSRRNGRIRRFVSSQYRRFQQWQRNRAQRETAPVIAETEEEIEI